MIDGFPSEDGMNSLDPAEIETIGILKDAINDELYADGYGIELWNNVAALMDGELITTKFAAWKELNQVAKNASEWYVPTPAMMVDMAGMLYNNSWTLAVGSGVSVIEAKFPAKNEAFSAAYLAGGEELALTTTAKNLLTSGVTEKGTYTAVQVNVDEKKMQLMLPAKANNSIALRPVLTVFASETTR